MAVDSIGKINFERLLKLRTSDISAHSDEYAEIILPKLDKIKCIFYEMV